jgi:hypothetical protein
MSPLEGYQILLSAYAENYNDYSRELIEHTRLLFQKVV